MESDLWKAARYSMSALERSMDPKSGVLETCERLLQRNPKSRHCLCVGHRSHDSMYHDAQRRKESAEINQSIYALKGCIRAANAARKWRERGWLASRCTHMRIL